ncbi:hypothetical protein F2Q70_00032954 [Brassica cretica]|uniref:Uncharacterized protein n=1 Tax=Brassica cretica TaxID=69181 RepID=A0A8S9FB98_BRACR|nr:hypothetical protein F2Q70_00032954 [Brassica cretica]
MGKKSSVSILCFILITFTPIFVSAQTCNEAAGTFKPNSPYDKNRRLINSTLASNVTAHAGYFNGSIGLGPDIVYALGMCAPDAEPQACSYCIQGATDSILSTCLNQTDAFMWSGEEIFCLVRYSSKSFSGVLSLEPITPFHNEIDIRKENQKEFDSVWDGLVLPMITRISSSVKNSSSTSSLSLSGKYYSKDVAPVPVYGNILVLMQCTPDISSKDCSLCLESSVDYYKKWFHTKRGTILLRPSCFFRWELYNFSGAFDNINDKKVSVGIILAIVVGIVVTIVLISLGLVMFKRKKKNQDMQLPRESVQFDFKTIEAATSNFSEANKLGAGGFGEVYKGILMNGTEVAVKRLSKASGQGEGEFKNEVVVVAKLQHRNLVRLLGFSLQGEEKLLVYEFVPNKSLDFFLVDNTSRVVGTFGYMPPEYVIHGQFSMKSDVYSFGVMILEIISGKKNSSFRQIDGLVNNLVTYVWRLWENKLLSDLIDPGIKEDCNIDEVIRHIHIGLLCVQENPADRPTMSTIHQMLTTSSITLPVPLPPGFFFGNRPGTTTSSQGLDPSQSSSKSYTCSVDEATITDVNPHADMNPKIADFGTARIFGMNQTVDNTSRVVGTFFGVMILEIISGKKNSSFRQTDGLVNNLVTYVWRLWENKSLPDLIDPGIKDYCKIDEVVRYIHIGLLCVQENPADRPTMSTIHQMLTTSSITLPVPLPPGFFFGNRPGMTTLSQGLDPSQSSSKSYTCSVDEATITDVNPR